jgi:hypothetical protein
MSQDRYTQCSCYALGAALALAASTALADASAPQLPVPESSMTLTVTEMMPATSGRTTQYVYPSSEAGLRRAAAQGPVALHLYIYRTRMIYNYYFWDFAKEE